jgi:hypothetical protein
MSADGARATAKKLERVKGIEPSSSAWKALAAVVFSRIIPTKIPDSAYQPQNGKFRLSECLNRLLLTRYHFGHGAAPEGPDHQGRPRQHLPSLLAGQPDLPGPGRRSVVTPNDSSLPVSSWVEAKLLSRVLVDEEGGAYHRRTREIVSIEKGKITKKGGAFHARK